MNKHFAKLTLSTAVALVASSSISAQPSQKKGTLPIPFEQGYEIDNNRFPAAYNAAARIDVQQGWDVFFTGSFTYWYVDEDGFQLAIDRTHFPSNEILFQSNEYSPGFKAGIGMNFGRDSWVGFAEYTWLRNRSTYSTPSTAITSDTLLDRITGPFSSIRRVNLDIVDLTLSRPFYEGRKLTLLPYSGLRSASLRQNFRVATSPSSKDTHSNTSSWFIGPNAGLALHWLLQEGLRLEGDLNASLLFQRYDPHFQIGSDLYQLPKQSRLAPVAGMGLGLGWGTYLSHQKTHLDIVATYDVMNWWGQNLIRQVADSVNSSSAQPGDLQISGLTLTGRFDF